MSQEKSERRFICRPLVRSQQQTDGKKILSGLAARFNTLSEDLGGWRERLAPGCFRACLATGADIKMLADHDSSKLLGRTANKTLTVWESSEGLAFRAALPSTSTADDVLALVQRGDLNEMSFGFRCTDQSWGEEPDPEDAGSRISVRTVKSANVFEISAVAFPAYSRTVVAAVDAARSLFSDGLVPAEIRSHVRVVISDEEKEMRRRARARAERLMPADLEANQERQALAARLRREFNF